MDGIQEDELEVLGALVAESLTNPEKYAMIIYSIHRDLSCSMEVSAVIAFTSYPWYITQDLSLKDFLKHWLEDYISVNN